MIIENAHSVQETWIIILMVEVLEEERFVGASGLRALREAGKFAFD